MHDAEKHLPGFRIAALEVGFDPVFEGASAGLVGLDEIAAAFVHHEQVVVFIEDVVGREHGLQAERKGKQQSGRSDDRGGTVPAHDHPHGRALAAFDIDHHLTALAAG